MAEFKYVKIPVDETQPLESCSATTIHDADALVSALKSNYAGIPFDEEAYKKQEKELGAISPDMKQELQDAVDNGSVEMFPLVRPSSSNSSCAVSIYLDTIGVLRGAQINKRATAICQACGFEDTNIYGDVFLGRVKMEPKPIRNVDLGVEEATPTSEWAQRAMQDNMEYAMEMGKQQQQEQEAAKEEPKTISVMAEKQKHGFTLKQSDSDIDVFVDAPVGTKGRDVKVKFGNTTLKVTVHGKTVLEVASLHAKVRPDDCTWDINHEKDGCIIHINMEKVEDGAWPELGVVPGLQL